MLFEKASRIKLRIQTSKGVASVEDLWDMSLQNLNQLAKGIRKRLKENEEEDFLGESSPQDTLDKLQFDIVLHILNTKKEEQNKRQVIAANKAEREKIMGILAAKEEESLKSLSPEELRKKLAELTT